MRKPKVPLGFELKFKKNMIYKKDGIIILIPFVLPKIKKEIKRANAAAQATRKSPSLVLIRIFIFALSFPS